MEVYVNNLTHEKIQAIFGMLNCFSDMIEEGFTVRLFPADESIKITGSDNDCEKAKRTVEYLSRLLDSEDALTEQNVRYAMSMADDEFADELEDFDENCVCITSRGRPVKAKTVGQKKYIDAIKNNTVVLGIGPAGTGKTFLAVAMAVNALRSKTVNRIILTRPAVEAGEKLGFLPGDLQNKIDPYLRPLQDALVEMLGIEGYSRHLEKGTIEIAPLAYMRGRTLDDSFIILDEAQNTTPEQMKMFLTRLGFGSKAVVTGDITQIDLPRGQVSGLAEASQIIKDIDGVSVMLLSDKDVVRHALVQRIILAYDKFEQKRKGTSGENEK